MTTNASKAIRYLEAANTGDVETLSALLAPDCALYVPKTVDRGLPNPHRGRETIVDAIAKGVATFIDVSEQKLEVFDTVSEGDLVALRCHVYTKIKASPQNAAGSYENDYFFLFRFRDGLIAEIHEYTDTAHSLAQWSRK